MELIFFAEDDDTYEAKQPSKDDMKRWIQQQNCGRDEMESSKEDENETEHILLIGWRDRMFEMIADLDATIGKGSTVTILCSLPLEQRVASLERSSFLKSGKVRSVRMCFHYITRNESLKHRYQLPHQPSTDSEPCCTNNTTVMTTAKSQENSYSN